MVHYVDGLALNVLIKPVQLLLRPSLLLHNAKDTYRLVSRIILLLLMVLWQYKDAKIYQLLAEIENQ